MTSQEQIAESILQNLLSANHKVELNAKTRMCSVLSTEAPHIIAQEQFTLNEWSMLLALLISYPYYVTYEGLIASFTPLSPSESFNLIHQAQQSGKNALRRELKPIHRTVSHIRAKLNSICPQLKISPVRETGYILTSSGDRRDMPK
jgi:hypothetical protein